MADPRREHGLAIIGPHGNIWHGRLFETPEDAIAYLNAFWGGKWDRSQWKLAMATQTTALDAAVTPGEQWPITNYTG